MIKRFFENKKVLLGLATVAFIFAVILVSSFWPFILDPSKIATKEFLTNELIITAIVLSVTSSFIFVAQASNNKNEDSEICKARVSFKKSIEKIENHTFFYQWVKKVLQENDKKEIVEREMNKLVLPIELYYMDDNVLETLTVAQKINDKFYGPYKPSQLMEVINLKKRVSRIKFVTPSYYTSVKAIQSDKTLSELAMKENLKKTMTVLVDVSSRVIMTWVSAMILGSLVRDLAQGDMNIAQAWMTFLSRGFSLFSSCFFGYNVGCKANDIDAFYILKRVEVHTMYLEDKTFKPVDESKEAFKDRVREESLLITNGGEKNGEERKENVHN